MKIHVTETQLNGKVRTYTFPIERLHSTWRFWEWLKDEGTIKDFTISEGEAV